MSLRTVHLIRVAACLLLCAGSAAAAPAGRQSTFIRALDQMMIALAPDSARASATIRRVYQQHLELLMLEAYTDMTGALDNGGLVPLPANPAQFNLAPRLDGPHPIGEKDLANQSSYVAARPATMGALIEIASRVKSGPVEVTSLVRHSHYQDALKATNANANTAVPTHALGLAFDIGVVNSKLRTVHEIRDVLRQMQRRGDILFIAERRQLVFHVVPHPSRLGHFTDVYMKKVGLPPTSRSAHVVAALPAGVSRARGPLRPQVTSEVLSVLPLADQPREPWRDEVATAALAGGVPAAPVAAAIEKAAPRTRPLQRSVVLLLVVIAIGWRLAPRPRTLRPCLIER